MTDKFVLDHCEKHGHKWRETKLNLSAYVVRQEKDPEYEFRVGTHEGFRCAHCGKLGYVRHYDFFKALEIKPSQKLLTMQAESTS